jgi:hypothetical protein
LEAPIVFQWEAGGIQKWGEGHTHDISELGAFVLASTCPPAGTEISFKISLSAQPGFEPKKAMEAVGQVVRVEQAFGLSGRDGFAILTRHSHLHANNQSHDQGDA